MNATTNTFKIADDSVLSPAKLDAYMNSLPFPIEEGDYIQWAHSYRVCGYVQSTSAILTGKTEIPAYRVWNVMLEEEQLIPVADAVLMGWR